MILATKALVVTLLGFRLGRTALCADGLTAIATFELVSEQIDHFYALGLEVNRSIRRRAFFDTDGLERGQILFLDVPQSVSVAGKADSQ